jgi:hypothetical protein
MSQIPPNTYKLNTANGYFSRHFQLLPFFDNQEQAYWALEKEHKEAHGFNKYSSFTSFRRCKNYHLHSY